MPKTRKQSPAVVCQQALARRLNSPEADTGAGAGGSGPAVGAGQLMDRSKSSSELDWARRAVRKAVRRSMLGLSSEISMIADHVR